MQSRGAATILFKTLAAPNATALADAARKLVKSDPDLAEAILGAAAALKSPALWVAIVGLLWVALAAGYAFWIAIREDAEAGDRSDPHHLRVSLLLLDQVVRRKLKLGSARDDLKKFRATLHRASKGEHVQCIPYVGWNHQRQGGGVGRKWSNACGLVGRVIRRGDDHRGKPLIAKMPETVKSIE